MDAGPIEPKSHGTHNAPSFSQLEYHALLDMEKYLCFRAHSMGNWRCLMCICSETHVTRKYCAFNDVFNEPLEISPLYIYIYI